MHMRRISVARFLEFTTEPVPISEGGVPQFGNPTIVLRCSPPGLRLVLSHVPVIPRGSDRDWTFGHATLSLSTVIDPTAHTVAVSLEKLYEKTHRAPDSRVVGGEYRLPFARYQNLFNQMAAVTPGQPNATVGLPQELASRILFPRRYDPGQTSIDGWTNSGRGI